MLPCAHVLATLERGTLRALDVGRRIQCQLGFAARTSVKGRILTRRPLKTSQHLCVVQWMQLKRSRIMSARALNCGRRIYSLLLQMG